MASAERGWYFVFAVQVNVDPQVPCSCWDSLRDKGFPGRGSELVCGRGRRVCAGLGCTPRGRGGGCSGGAVNFTTPFLAQMSVWMAWGEGDERMSGA
jgi:hypothetical protein